MPASIDVTIKTEYIKISQLLKLANVVSQGADARVLIEDGLVALNGERVSERGKKVRPGDCVAVSGPLACEIKIRV